MNNPSAVSDSDGEWFEIVNNGDIPHNLYGWTIKDNGSDSHVIGSSFINNPDEYSSFIINPGEYKVLSNNSDQKIALLDRMNAVGIEIIDILNTSKFNGYENIC